MNTRQIHIFFRFSKVIRQFVWLFLCFVRVANPFVNLKLHLCYITLRIKTKTILGSVFSSQILQHAEINIVVHWKSWKKYESVSHLLCCMWLKITSAWELEPIIWVIYVNSISTSKKAKKENAIKLGGRVYSRITWV